MTSFIHSVTPSNQSLVFEGAKHNFGLNHKFIDRYSTLIIMLQLPGFISHVESELVFRPIDYRPSVVFSRIFTHLIACANNNIYRNCDRSDVKTCDFSSPVISRLGIYASLLLLKKAVWKENFGAIVSFVESLFIISSLIFTARKGAFSSVNSFFAFEIQICHHERNDARCCRCIFKTREFEWRKCIRKIAIRKHRCGTSKRI